MRQGRRGRIRGVAPPRRGSPSWRTPRRTAALTLGPLLLAPGLVLVGCGGSGPGPGAAGAPAPAAARASGSSGPAVAGDAHHAPARAGTTVPAPPPRLLTTGDDLDAAIRSMLAYQDWALGRPDPARPRRWIAADSPCLAEQQETHRYLRTHRRRAELHRDLESVRLADHPDPHHALLVVRGRITGARLWTDGGRVAEDLGASPSRTEVYALTRDPVSMEWRMSCTRSPR